MRKGNEPEYESLSALFEANRVCINSEGVKEMTTDKKKHEIIKSSPKALALCVGIPEVQAQRMADEERSIYPFKSLLIGESFVIQFADTTPGVLPSLRSSASVYSKRLSRKYRVFIHDEYACIEVARIA
jgi:hypothetical protein